MQEGLKKAVLVPMKLAMTASALFAPLQELAQLGNINCKSDLQVIFIRAESIIVFLKSCPTTTKVHITFFKSKYMYSKGQIFLNGYLISPM